MTQLVHGCPPQTRRCADMYTHLMPIDLPLLMLVGTIDGNIQVDMIQGLFVLITNGTSQKTRGSCMHHGYAYHVSGTIKNIVDGTTVSYLFQRAEAFVQCVFRGFANVYSLRRC